MAEAGYKPLKDVVKDAALLREQRKEIDTLRAADAKDWALNAAFYMGDQWSYVNSKAPGGWRLETLPVEEGDKPRHKVRLTANQIQPGVNHYVAQLTKTKPTIHATPDSGSDKDIKAAQMAEMLYEHLTRELGLRSKLVSALVHAQLSQGYWWVTYDKMAGKSLKFMLDPNTGQPILNEQLSDLFREEMGRAGVPMDQFEMQYYVGDIDVKVKGGEDVWLDPTANMFQDAKYAIVREYLSPDEIKARYKKDVEPDSSLDLTGPEVALSYMSGKNQKTARPKNVRAVYHGYFRPTPMLPKGRHVVWVEGPDTIIHQGDWDLPFDKLPLVKFPGVERPGSIIDEARVTQARPLQQDLNRTLSQIREWTNLTVRPQMVAPVGSLRQKITTEPGAIFEFNPINGMSPEWRPVPGLPGSVFNQLSEVQSRLSVIFNQMPTQRDQLPARIDSAGGIDLIHEAVADQMSNEILRLEEALALAGTLMISLAQANYNEPRLLKITGTGGAVQVKKFMSSDIGGAFTFHAEAGSGLPRTRAGKQQRIMELAQMGIIQPHQLWKHLDIADIGSLATKFQADEDQALREHDKLIAGQPLNVLAMQDAIQAVQTGMNPMTGQPFQSEEEALSVVETAALSPNAYDNHAAHMEIHATFLKTMEYEALPPDIQQRFIQHFTATQQALQSLTAQQPETPKVNLSLKGTVGPTVAADILQSKGIQSANPETMQEPALSTSVYDSVDQPDMDEAGNDPLSDVEQQLLAEHLETERVLKRTKMAADAALAMKRAAQADHI